MPDLYSAIGLEIGSEEDLKSILEHALDEKHLLSANGIAYCPCKSTSGAELWVQLDMTKRSVVRINPHFAGESRLLVNIDEVEPQQAESVACDGFFRADLPMIGDPETTNEFVLDVPDVGLQKHIGE